MSHTNNLLTFNRIFSKHDSLGCRRLICRSSLAPEGALTDLTLFHDIDGRHTLMTTLQSAPVILSSQ